MESTGISQEVKRRLARGIGATALGPIITATIQLGSVPLLLHAWGAAKYGDWVLMSAIPSYLSLSDLGFGDAAATDMTIKVAAGDKPGALRTFQSAWTLLTGVSLLILLLAFPMTWFIPWQSWLHLSSLTSQSATAVILTLAAYIVVGQQMGVMESGYRSDGNYAMGFFWLNVIRFIEAVVATAIGLSGSSLFAVAFAYLAVRMIGTVVYAWMLMNKSPWIRLGVRHAEAKTIKAMVKPAIGFIALPAGHALNGQGLTVIIGTLLGPAAVAAFATLRTLTRINFQITNVIAVSLWPELSTAFGRKDIPLARRLHRRAYQVGLGLALLGGAALWFTGQYIYTTWTRHALVFDVNCFHVLIFVTLINSLWFTSSVVPMSTNGHSRIALSFVVVSSLSLGVAWLVIPHVGVTGAALALLCVDSFMAWLVLRQALLLVQDNVKDLLASTLDFFQPARVAPVAVLPVEPAIWDPALQLDPVAVEKEGPVV